MRIAHIITRMILGGAQENTLLTCEDLQNQFHDDVLLITGPAIGPEGSLLQRAQRSKIPVATVDSLRREVHPWRDWRSYRAIKRHLVTFKPDVVHTHSAKGGILGRMAAHSLGIPAIVHTVHGAPFHSYQSWPARRAIIACERYAVRRCHALISVADAMTEQLVQAQIADREKFTTIPSGMEVEPFLHANEQRRAMRHSLGYAEHHVVVGKIARLFNLKGHAEVIEAAKSVLAVNPNVRFLFIGDGILRGQLERQARRSGVEAAIRFAGLIEPEKIPDYIGAMDIVVHASLREGLARVLPQALIARKPVISYDIDGAREVVLPDKTGVLVPPRLIEQLAAAVNLLVGDRSLRERFGEEGSRRFVDQFRHEVSSRMQRELYLNILSRQAGEVSRNCQHERR